MSHPKKLIRHLQALALAPALTLGAAALGAGALVWEAPAAHAQQEVTAAVLAARVQAFYDQTTTVQADFRQHFWVAAHARTQSSRGTITIQRPGRIRFDYAAPAGKVVVSTPAGFTYYEPGDDGAPGQYTRGQTEGASAALGFLTGTASLSRDFRFALRAAGGDAPANTDALELRPRRADPHYRRVVLYVDNRPDTLGVVRRVAIEDPDGNWNRFDFTNLRFNREVSASTFQFQPPRGAREINAPAVAPSAGSLPGPGSGR